MAMSYGKGYLGKPKEQPQQQGGMSMGGGMDEGGEEQGGDHEAIHSHLKQMHEMDGKAHSHIVHHGDGGHEAHHVDMNGETSGPEEHGDCTGGMCGGQ